MASLILVTGPPGAGKSTVTRVLAARFDPSVLLEGDTFFSFLATGAIPPWLSEAGDQNDVVIQAAAAAAGRYVSGGYETVYDGVVGPWFLPTFVAASGLEFVHYVVLLPSIDECLTRIKTRQGHGFDDEGAARHMHQQFARAELDERYVLTGSPDQGVEDVAEQIVAAVDRGTLRYRV
jgi:gluconate kinase